jgi:DNA polymerase V
LIKVMRTGLAKIYRSGIKYKRAGVMLLDLVDQKKRQLSLFEEVTPVQGEHNQTRKNLMTAMDSLNKKYGRHCLHYGLSSTHQWKMSQNHLSPAYTTRWRDIPVIR